MTQYATGTVTVTNADATVTGSGTAWDGEVAAGDLFTIVDSGVVYEVASVTSDTELELTSTYAGSTAAAQSYTIARDFTPTYDIPYINKTDIEKASILKRMALKIEELLSARQNIANGTFSPVLTDGTNNVTTYFYQVGRYTKIDDRVFIEVHISVNDKGSITGDLKITGLPYTTANETGAESAFAAYAQLNGFTPTAGDGFVAFAPANDTEITILTSGLKSTTAAVQGANVTGGTQIHITGSYRTTA